MIGQTHARRIYTPLLTVAALILVFHTNGLHGESSSNNELVAVTSAETGVTQYLPAATIAIPSQQLQDGSMVRQRFDLPLQATATAAIREGQLRPDYALQGPAVVRSAKRAGQEVVTQIQQDDDDTYDDDDDTYEQDEEAVTAAVVDSTEAMTANGSSSAGQSTAPAAAAASNLTRNATSPPPAAVAAAGAASRPATSPSPSLRANALLPSPAPLPSPAAAAAMQPAMSPSPSIRANLLSPSPTPPAAAAAAPNGQGAAAVSSITTRTPSAAISSSPAAAAAAKPVSSSAAVIKAPSPAPNPTTPPQSPAISPAAASSSSSGADAVTTTQEDPATGDYSDYSPDDAFTLEDSRSQSPTAQSSASNSSSTAAKIPIRVVTPTTMPPIAPAPQPASGTTPSSSSAAAAAVAQSGGSNTLREGGQAATRISDQPAASRSASQLSTTVVTVRAPTDTPVTVKVRPGGPDTAVDVLVDGDSNTMSMTGNNSVSDAPVTVQVDPQANSGSNGQDNVMNMDNNQVPPQAVPGPSTSSTGLEPVFTIGDHSGVSVGNTSNTPAVPNTATPKTDKNYTDIPPWVFAQTGATDNIKLGCILPFEGSQALLGAASLTAMKMAVTELAPKLLPRSNITLLCENTKCVDVAAHNGMLKLADMGVVAVLGEVCSGASVAAAGVASDKKLPMISPASTSTTLTSKEFFLRTAPSDRYQGAALANLMTSNGVRAVGLVYEDSTYGYGLAFNFIAAFTNLNGTVPSVYKFARGTPGDPKAAVAQMLAARNNRTQAINAVFVTTSNLDFVAGFLKEAYAAKLNLPIYGGDSLADQTLLLNVKGSNSDISRVIATVPNPGTEAFEQAFIEFSNGQMYDSFAAQAYDAMRVVLGALAATNSTTDGTALRAEMIKQKFQGVSGPIEFDQQGDLKPAVNSYAWVVFDSTKGRPVPMGFVDARRRSLLRLRLL